MRLGLARKTAKPLGSGEEKAGVLERNREAKVDRLPGPGCVVPAESLRPSPSGQGFPTPAAASEDGASEAAGLDFCFSV